ncbi:hypothetical protein [Calothrix sp. NIES-3974]|uniref:hypothetical protein n=1 Tax=Calothrix sp. NIES-3974 TaxID=2005462 RepID=UPI000B5FAA98|nr:hypothetical protein [Calothrix sp. NIES-3974]BAZ04078.1 hypothetical protein NIES3974_07080 [Calothrix sp. NIES-3974]
MERGLFWLPLLIIFFWLAWQGAREYQKIEAYKAWAENFDRAKYDIYAVLGQKDNLITWGKPAVNAPVSLQTFCLDDVQQVRLLVNNTPIEFDTLPPKAGNIALEFRFKNSSEPVQIPFTEVPLANEWGKFLQGRLGG